MKRNNIEITHCGQWKHYIFLERLILELWAFGSTTCTDLCLVELGYPTFSAMLDQRMSDFMRSFDMYSDRGDPLNLDLEMCSLANTKVYRTLTKSRDRVSNAVTKSRPTPQLAVNKFTSSSKRAQYMSVNPNGDVHRVYKLRDDHAPQCGLLLAKTCVAQLACRNREMG